MPLHEVTIIESKIVLQVGDKHFAGVPQEAALILSTLPQKVRKPFNTRRPGFAFWHYKDIMVMPSFLTARMS
jgi:hypothetical protein